MRRGPTMRWLVSLLAAVSMTAAPACTPDDDPGTAPTRETGDPAQTGLALVPSIVDQVSPSIVAIVVSMDGRPLGQGSGVIWSDEGHIVTNSHVVAAGEDIQVALADGRILDAELVGQDPSTDLAVVRVDGGGLPDATFSEGVPEVGEMAVALGNPFGFANSATAGIVSGLDRDVPAGDQSLVGLIQTDAPISPGNSGGALVDAGGEVVGINVAAIPPQAGASSLGFAIPAPLVTDVVESLIETGTVEHPFLGIRGRTLTPPVADGFGMEQTGGVVLVTVVDGGPAAEAGLRPGDVIVSIAGDEVEDMGDLLVELRRLEPGDVVGVAYVRGGDEQQADVTLGTVPKS